ncbi:37S ribosomal protein S23, mitochondrial [Fusarium odoratissimum]|uniref:Small ribosomal subunit protein mS29 n=1 Tax=Fusarium oxysporum f. sp. cubense (strain race 4) TaxID=2502994 RepID=N1RHV2_FUSC4|nr:37S ribosomal protein S23, mitochondrial [Fusarium odoratissimum]
MASANSLRCLMRPTIPRAPRIQPVLLAPFSTSNAALAVSAPPAIKSRRDLPQKVKKSYKKRANVTPVRKPQPGERKAFRKRIQLSNNSALPVAGLENLDASNMTKAESAGKIKLSGKSMAMLQAMAYALLNNWVVFHVPEGQDLTNGNTEYSPIPETEPMQFSQPIYCLKMIQSLYRANRVVLEKLNIEKDWSKFTNLKEGATLADLALSAKEAEYAWPTLLALWTELTLPGRPPVLFALDGLAHINKISDYRDPSFNEVHAHELTLVRLFIDALSGKTPLPNGGAVIAATSENNSHHHPSQELVLSQLEAGQAGREIPKPDPYERKYDERVYEALKNSWVLRLEGITKDEARSLMEYWGASGLFRHVLNSRTVSEKWTVGGHGNVGEMERAALMQMRL